MTVLYITTNVLTKGIRSIELENPHIIGNKILKFRKSEIRKPYWYKTLEEAKNYARREVLKEIKKQTKYLEHLEKLEKYYTVLPKKV